jgi:sulfide:quinone oxidoreductase
MPADGDSTQRLRVLIAGGGIAALEAVLALRELAGERISATLLAPNEEVLYRPMTVREPFSYAEAGRYELAPIARELGAELVVDRLDRVDRERQTVHTEGGLELPYDALIVALGAQPRPRYAHAIAIDDRSMDETLHGLIQDLEGGYLRSIAFLIPERIAWQLPAYELALMTAGRAFDSEADVAITIVTAEPTPLALFGETVSSRVAELLGAAGVETLTSSTAETPRSGEVLIEPGGRRLQAQRVIGLPELYGPAVRGLPAGEHGFLAIDEHCRVRDAGPVFAAGDATDSPVKHGGLSTQQADAAAEAIAALAGVPLEPQPLRPVLHAMLLTDGRPLYLTAEVDGTRALSSEVSETPTWSPPTKIAARFLGPYLERLDRQGAPG